MTQPLGYPPPNRVYAVYRYYTGYGGDFLQESILSVAPYVDRIFVFWTNRALMDTTSAVYKGEVYQFTDFENHRTAIADLEALGLGQRLVLIEDYVRDNMNQFTHLVNDLILPNYAKPSLILFVEPDHVFKEAALIDMFHEFNMKQLQVASTRQVELWRHGNYAIPERERLASVIWSLDGLDSIPPTGRHANPLDSRYGFQLLSSVYVHNFGFCMNPGDMLAKLLTGLAFSSAMGDDEPDPEWYAKWLRWTIDSSLNRDLEISKGCQSSITRANYYDVNNLPARIKVRYVND